LQRIVHNSASTNNVIHFSLFHTRI